MTGTLVLLHLAGAVALLLWATRMVRTGVERAFGDTLGDGLRKTLGNPVGALLAGLGLAVALQSATAVSLLVGSFAGSGFVGGASALVAVLGADVGSALVVRLLSFDLEILVPISLFAGTAIFLSTERRGWRQAGRIIVGIGLLLLSLRLIGEASEPLRGSELLPVIVNYLSGDPVTAFLIAAVTTWLFHSSVAAILLIAALASRGLMPAELGIVMMLGANLGGALIAAMLSRSMRPAGRAVPLGNLAIRGAGAVVALGCFMLASPPVAVLGHDAPTQIIHGHLAFNIALALVGLFLAGPVYRAIRSVLPADEPTAEQAIALSEVSALDDSVLDTPSLALANATRETVAICEIIERMLTDVIGLYEKAEKAEISALAALDDRVDRRHAAIKLYLAKITTRGMTEAEALRCQELLGACVKLEQVGDIVVRNLLVQVQKKRDRRLAFTNEGWTELRDFHGCVLSNARLAFNVLVSRNRDTAFRLMQEKERLRELEKVMSERHFGRLRVGTEQSVETSSIHLDTIRDLKQINSLLASIAYPVLEENGMLRGSRLTSLG